MTVITTRLYDQVVTSSVPELMKNGFKLEIRYHNALTLVTIIT